MAAKHSRGLYWSNRQSSVPLHSVVTWISPEEGTGDVAGMTYRPRKCKNLWVSGIDTAIEMWKNTPVTLRVGIGLSTVCIW